MGQTSNQQLTSATFPVAPVSPPNQPNFNFLNGYKTYMVAGAMIVYAILGIYLKYMQSTDAITLVLQALGLMGLRLGIAKQGS